MGHSSKILDGYHSDVPVLSVEPTDHTTHLPQIDSLACPRERVDLQQPSTYSCDGLQYYLVWTEPHQTRSFSLENPHHCKPWLRTTRCIEPFDRGLSLAHNHVICWENIALQNRSRILILSFVPKILTIKEWVHHFGPLCIKCVPTHNNLLILVLIHELVFAHLYGIRSWTSMKEWYMCTLIYFVFCWQRLVDK